ncbi:YhdP family protein [Amphritea japonica]|nr:YhdP family protein [Amphritea japonica]
MVLRSLNRWLGWFLVIAILLIALLTVVVRQLLPAVWDYREEIEQYLSDRLRTEVSIGDINASWEGRFPTLLIQDMVIADHRSQNIGRVEVGQLVLGLNPVSSLLKWQPVLSKVELWSLHTEAKLVSWPQPHTQNSPSASKKSNQAVELDPLAALWLQPHIFFYDTQIDLTLPSGKQLLLQSESINLENSQRQHHFSGELLISHEQQQLSAVLRVESEGAQFNPKTTRFDFYLQLAGVDTPLLEAARELFPIPTALKQLELGAEIWGSWSEGRLTRMFGNLATDKLKIVTGSDQLPELEVQELSTGFVLLQPARRQFQLQVNEFTAQINHQPLTFPQLIINRQQGKITSVGLTELDVKSTVEFIKPQSWVPEALKGVIKEMAPVGKIWNLALEWPEVSSEAVAKGSPDSLQNWTHLNLKGDLDQVGFSAAYGVPAMAGINGLLQLEYGTSGLQGRIDLESDNLGLHFPDIFDKGWEFTSARGVTHFSLAEDVLHLRSERAEVKKAGINANGRWSLHLPLIQGVQSELTLLIGVKGSDGSLAPELIPDHEIDPGIKPWVAQAVKRGHINQGGFMLHTGTRNIPERQSPTVQMFMDIADAAVDYQVGWPAVTSADASLLLREQGLSINVSDGQILNSKVDHGWVYLPPGSNNLSILARVSGDSADIGRTLIESPVIGSSKELASWQLSGQADTQLSLMIPLDGKEPDIDVSSRFTELKLISKERNLSFDKLSGLIGYRNDRGLYSEPLSGVFFGQPLTANIKTSGSGQAEVIRTRFKSSIKIKQLREWSGVDLLALAEGNQPFDADLDICVRSGCSGLTVRSDLKKTHLDMIPPFSKKAGEKMPLLLRTDFESPRTVNIKLGDQLSAWLQVDNNKLNKGHLTLGGGDARPTDFTGLMVGGSLQQLDYDQLFSMLQGAKIIGEKVAVGNRSPITPVQLDVDITELSYADLRVLKARVLLERLADSWRAGVTSPDLKVLVDMPDNSAKAPTLLFEQLNLDSLLPTPDGPLPQSAEVGGENVAVETTKGLLAMETAQLDELLQPGSISDLDFEVRDLILKGKRWGQWQFNVRNREGRTYIENIVGQLPGLDAKGGIVWQPGEPSQSQLKLVISAKNLGESLTSAGYEKVLETEKFGADLQLTWPGAPWEYELAAINGAAKFSASEGRLIESGGAAGFLRVFGILNMNALGRRLKLDFADLFSKGVSFDRMEGDYRISEGVAIANTPFVMRGPSLDMAMSGEIDLVNETVDQQMAVTLPVTDNLPFAAVLLGAPQIAGLAFLLDKLVGDKVKKEFATVTYTMVGDWSDPKVELLQQKPKTGSDSAVNPN